MAILNIQLRDDLQIVARARATERGYASVEEYLAELIEADGAVARSEELEAEILDRLASPARETTPADWDEMRRRFRASNSQTGRL